MIQAAHTAYNAKNYKKAFQLYETLAENGDVTAQTSLAFMYQNALGIDKDDAKALSLYREAAKQKQPYALFNLALLYTDGTGGVMHDQFMAYELYLEAAEREVPPAMYEVALMLERGLGCMQNYSESAFWYEEAAQRGHVEAFNN
ncbi:MAG: sel1 repeat family protein, partial [Thiovulaceae bacterium]|nr:sel1 repeat family protein [Sulfurimonadaceae bacterium]